MYGKENKQTQQACLATAAAAEAAARQSETTAKTKYNIVCTFSGRKGKARFGYSLEY